MLKILLMMVVYIPYSLLAAERVGQYPPSRRYAPIVKEIDQQHFKQLISEVESIYKLEDNLSQLEIEGHWDNSFTVAYSSKRDGKWILYVNGGMARATHMTADGFRLLLCHEMGHFIGGAPFASINRWAAVEGQADYFAASKCMKRVLSKLDNEEFIKKHIVPVELEHKCSKAYSEREQQLICMRTALAGEALISAFAYMLDEVTPSLERQDHSVVNQTIIDDYPSIQCRLDTVVAGAMCDIDPVGTMSSMSAHENGCTAQNGYTMGLRPACWFNESEFY